MAGQWSVRVDNVELPLVGAISMNYSSAYINLSSFDVPPSQGRPEHGDVVHVISSDLEHSNNRHEMARINHTITRELLIKMDEKIRRVVV
jgi:alanine racemase